jgi:hypothetical protein
MIRERICKRTPEGIVRERRTGSKEGTKEIRR